MRLSRMQLQSGRAIVLETTYRSAMMPVMMPWETGVLKVMMALETGMPKVMMPWETGMPKVMMPLETGMRVTDRRKHLLSACGDNC